jgi:hypothetical protein
MDLAQYEREIIEGGFRSMSKMLIANSNKSELQRPEPNPFSP